jgi:hypothetical protein
MAKMKLPEDVMEFFRQTGAEGGKARAAKYSKAQLSRWAKKGGRPKGSGTKQQKGGK